MAVRRCLSSVILKSDLVSEYFGLMIKRAGKGVKRMFLFARSGLLRGALTRREYGSQKPFQLLRKHDPDRGALFVFLRFDTHDVAA